RASVVGGCELAASRGGVRPHSGSDPGRAAEAVRCDLAAGRGGSDPSRGQTPVVLTFWCQATRMRCLGTIEAATGVVRVSAIARRRATRNSGNGKALQIPH